VTFPRVEYHLKNLKYIIYIFAFQVAPKT